ncbi:ABC transporter ATP-binding protein [Algivirga pacifica]|uniref:2-aminoethylphosphonate ABC transporter ATP-binding protein n=1 Tax=Algivirga pacifica TaxID=1162670 RepID=A0ABP9CVS7_9BACT
MGETILQVANLQKQYEQREIIKDLSFSIEKGEIFALIGESGCGKTTTLRCIAGLEQVTGGEVRFQGETIIGPWDKLIAGHEDIKVVSQTYDLFMYHSVWENIKHPLRTYTREYQEYRIRELLRLCRLEGLEDKKPENLSGGERQRVAFACALADDPALLVMDEPFSNLDIPIKSRLRREVRRIVKETNTTVLFVSHDTQDALAIADKVGVMKDGELIQIASPLAIYETPQNPYVATFFPHANILTGKQLTFWGIVRPEEENFVIRPEHIRIVESEATRAEIIDIEYTGAQDVLEVRVEEGCHVYMYAQVHQYEIGDTVHLLLQEEYLHAFSEENRNICMV